MAVVKESSIKRYIGLSTDTKPTSIPAGSTFYEYDTALLYITYDDGTNWAVKPSGGGTGSSGSFTVFTSSAATTTTITAAALADVASQYIGQVVLPLQGAMAGEARYITAYNGTNQLTVSPAWASDPDAAAAIKFAVMSGALGIMPVALGTNGTTVTDSAATVLGAVGANNNNNAFSSSSVAADADGSVLEREEYIQVEIAKVPKSDSTVTWNATALASIQTEADDALIAENLDHLAKVATSGADMTTEITDGTILSRILTKQAGGDTSDYDNTTDSLEAISDRIAVIEGIVGAPQTLSAANDTVAQGFYAATTLSAVDTDLAAANIKDDVTIFGKIGTFSHTTTPITASTVKTGLVGFENGNQITGTGTKTLAAANETVEAGYYEATTLSAVDADLATTNILNGKTIFGFAGVDTVRDIADADLTIAETPTGKKFYAVTGGVKTGTGTKTLAAANETVDAGYYEATTLSAVDSDLAAANIAVGKTIFGFIGSYTSDGEVKSTGTLTSSGVDVTPTDTVLIDAKTYTFVNPIGVTEGNVLCGTSAADTLDNLKAAINHAAGNGTTYVCAAAHPTVEATTNTDTVQTLQALVAGHAGNVALVTTAVTLTPSGATLTGGLSAAVAGDIATGHFAWVNGVKVEGSG